MEMNSEKKSEAFSAESEIERLSGKIEAQRVQLELLTIELGRAKAEMEKTNRKPAEYEKSATAGFFMLDSDGTICDVNLSGAMMLKNEPSMLIKNKFVNFIDVSAQPEFGNFLTRVFQSNSRETCEIKLGINDKDPVFIHIEGIVPENEKKCITTVIDITALKLAVNQHIVNELRLSRAMEATSDGLYDMDVPSNTAYCNSRYYSMLGYELYELPPTTETWLSLMHPDDKETAFFNLTEQVMQKCEFLEQEYRLKHKNGSWVWILDRSRIMEYDESGRPLKIVGTHIDITERKVADEKIRRLLREKEIILTEVNHRIKNNMLSVQVLLYSQAVKNENPAVKSILMDESNRLKSMAVLYDKLYLAENKIESSAMEFLPALISEIISVFPEKDSVKIKTEIEDIILHAKILSPLGMIINELINNTMKYAFKGCDDCTITITVSKVENCVSMIYGDNGSGIPEYVTIGDTGGFGLQLVSMLTEQLDGTMRIERDKGLKFIFQFGI